MRPGPLTLGVVLLTGLTPRAARAAECANVMVVFDQSDSMNRLIPGDTRSRWEVAVPATQALVARYEENVEFGLMLFPGDGLQTCGVACTPGFVAVEIGSGNAGAISDALDGSRQCSGTPIGVTLDQIPGMNALREEGKRNYVLLVTDGSETCDTHADEVAATLMAQDPEVRTFVIGFGDQVDSGELDRIAGAGGTRGAFVATDEATLEAAFDEILGAVYEDPEFGCVGGGIGDGGIPGLDSGVPDAGASDDAGAPPATGADDGCGCRLAAARPPNAGLAVLGVLALALRRPRRRA